MMLRLAIACGTLAVMLLAACTSTDSETTIEVVSTDTACDLSTTTASTGSISFEVSNEGSDATEFYLYSADGATVIGEVEDIGPGLTRSLVVEPEPGSYVTACKPGMTGDGIRAAFEVSGG
jgi:iron uptake system component EfeO